MAGGANNGLLPFPSQWGHCEKFPEHIPKIDFVNGSKADRVRIYSIIGTLQTYADDKRGVAVSSNSSFLLG